MTDRSKFEQMLEHLVNEDTEQARELFHQIVVEKSRQIYENILAEDFEVSEEEDKEDEEEDEVDEAKDEEEDDEMEENFAFDEGDDDEGPVGGDPTDDMLGDIEDEEGDDEMDMDMGDEEGEGDLEDRVLDLEDAMDELRAQFEKELGGMGDDEMDMDMGDDEMDMDMDDKDTMKMGEDDMFMREYVEKVGGADYTKYGKMGDNGANTKSVVAGKNDMGGTSANILAGGESTTGGTKGGLANPSTKEENFGNINVPGGNAGKTAFKKKEPGHGAEKKGAAEQSDNKKSIIGGKK